MKKNINYTDWEHRNYFNHCSENLDEIIQNNRFFKEIRKNLVRKKFEKYFEEIGESDKE